MIFWAREILGWLLMALGLYVFYIAMQMLLREGPLILEAPAFISIGFIVFRGGLQVLKVSVATRVCQEAFNRDAKRSASSARDPHSLRPASRFPSE